MINSHKVTKHACTSSWSPLAHSIHHTYHQVTVMNKKKAINNSYIYIHISCKCDTNRAGHFTLDAHASKPVACFQFGANLRRKAHHADKMHVRGGLLLLVTWWRHDVETLSAWLVLCDGKHRGAIPGGGDTPTNCHSGVCRSIGSILKGHFP